ncbi:MAG: (2Fe-2S)-binding protein, partial [Rhodospirillaceae bacterium]|nr:(2Fe-2S)-binding protein [Rhodospirillaceae bacterium]
MTTFFLNGREVEALPGESIKRCAKRLGVEIPGMCSGINPGYRRDGSCRLCMVEVEGERTLVASCVRQPSKGMKVESESESASTARAGVMELLLANRPALMRHTYLPANRFLESAADIAVDTTRRFEALTPPAPDVSHPAMSVDMAKCILCTNCVRACRDVQGNDVIGIAGRGREARIVFDLEDPLATSTCVACGECVQACPTGALLPKLVSDHAPDDVVKTLCPYCGVGCQVSYHTTGKGKDKRIVYAEGLDGPANQHRLCVKGRFGFDY